MSKHGGNVRHLRTVAGTSALVDFSANINPLGPPAWLRQTLSRNVENLAVYPDIDCVELREACARAYGVPDDHVLPGNGESELIRLLPRALSATRVLVPSPAYVDYVDSARAAGIPHVILPCRSDFTVDHDALAAELAPGDLVFLGHPSNPAGALLDAGRVLALAREHPASYFAIDEAFIDFVSDEPTFLPDLPENLIVLRSFTKFFAIPGLRLGCMVAHPDITRRVRSQQPDWSVNGLAQAVGVRALQDVDYARRTREAVTSARKELVDALRGLDGLEVMAGVANYLLLRLAHGDMTAGVFSARLLQEHGIAVRVCDNYDGLGPEYLRVAVRAPHENARLVSALADVFGVQSPRIPGGIRKSRRAKPLMIQGTASNAGKSLLTAAFCRILLEDGVRVAPFKAQNMSLNSFVTAQGGEVARAQAVQAGACRLDPDVRMSPVLLKPGSETGSQVIIAGKPVGHMHARDYQTYKATAWREVRACYDDLAGEFDAIVLEGAGSPGEVNLKHNEIVNMNMARYAEAPVLLAGDIDRGGVFASFVGTMEVLEEWERGLVAGFLVNRFRGDASLLGSALDYMLDFTGKPVLGVIPYLAGHGLPEEDSVNFKDGASYFSQDMSGDSSGPARPDTIEIALIDLPYISNFTDFEPLSREPDVRLRVVRKGDSIGNPDVVILPGTKNTLHDLAYLEANGLAAQVQGLAGQGVTEIVGVCGGMQMLGRRVHDPERIETEAGGRGGLALLDLETTLAPEKTLRRVTVRHRTSGLEVTGYEIHHGVTVAPAEHTEMQASGEVTGVASATGAVWGTYLHGLFDGDEFRRWFIDRQRVRKGLPALGAVQTRYDLEPAFARLAAHVRENVELDTIYRIMGL